MLNIGRGRLFSLLAEYQLLVPVKRTCQKAANSHQHFYRHPNLLKLSSPANVMQAREIVEESIAIYNHERPHLGLKYKTPDEIHQAFYRKKGVNLCQD